MRIKFNRGPKNGERAEFPGYGDEIRIAGLRDHVRDYNMADAPPAFSFAKEGTYHRSNVTLKDGTVVFEWMGWKK